MNKIDKSAARRQFNRAVTSYDGAAVLQRHVADELLDRLEIMGLEATQVLDIGCGTGYLAAQVAARTGWPAVALDLAPAMAAAANRHHGVSAFCGDAESLPLADACCDLVLSNMALQWCDFPRVFEEVWRILKPGGLWLFTSVGPDSLYEMRQAWAAAGEADRVHEFVDMHHLGDALLGRGFKEPVLDIERITLTYGDVSALLKDFRNLGVVNAGSHRPRGLTGRRALERFSKAYEQFRRADDQLPLSWEIIFGHARRPGPARVRVDFDPGLSGGRS